MSEHATAPPADEITAIEETPQSGAVAPSTKKNVYATDFGDDSVKKYDFDRYKGRKNVTDRIGILDPNLIQWGRVHYTEKTNFFICHSEWKTVGNQDVCVQMASCCEKLEAPEKRFATFIIHYNTDGAGKLVQPFTYGLKVWQFSSAKYIDLREIHKEWSLAEHDLKMACEDDKYQRFTITPYKDKVLSTDAFKKKFGEGVAEFLKQSAPKLASQIARTFTSKELVEALGMASTPAVVQQSATVEDIKELLES